MTGAHITNSGKIYGEIGCKGLQPEYKNAKRFCTHFANKN
jgi:hypothetical protein